MHPMTRAHPLQVTPWLPN